MPAKTVIFVKLGGSFITEKDKPYTLATERLRQGLGQVKELLDSQPGMQLVLGHGSGSFGHAAAKGLDLASGLRDQNALLNFQRVWFAAQQLHRLVITEAQGLDMPVISFPASAAALTENKTILGWDLSSLQAALERGFIPVVYGDTVMDTAKGGVILSTEAQFAWIANSVRPERVFLLGTEKGVFADFPARTQLIPKISASAELSRNIIGSEFVDVTGGMLAKVQAMQQLCREIPGLRANILSGHEPHALVRAFNGGALGTEIAA